MPRRRMLLFTLTAALIVVLSATLSACQRATPDPTATPNQASLLTANALFAQPTPGPRHTVTPTPINAVELGLNRALARMEEAVLRGDVEGYLAYVWPEDTTFVAEQTRWAADWVERPLSVFDLSLNGIAANDDATRASGRLTISWSQRDEDLSGGATVSAVFYHEGDQWYYAGEDWHTLEADGIRLYYFANALLDNRLQAETLAEDLPEIYIRLTNMFDVTPDETIEIKMYAYAATLRTLTRISDTTSTTSNVPGEAIKLLLGPSSTAPRAPDVAREVTRRLLYQLSGGATDRFSWWLEAGITEFGAAQFRPLSQRNRTIERIAALDNAPPNAEQRLFTWDELANRSALAAVQPALSATEAFDLARDQAYTLVHYIDATYGQETRNAWIEAMAGGAALDDATETHLGAPFDALDAGWHDWLREQL